jgi:type IV pilus assembly protein PilB
MTGYFGRVGVFEVLEVTPHIIKLVTERATAEDIQKKAANDGMLTLQEDGFIKALQGMTAVEEIIPLAAT